MIKLLTLLLLLITTTVSAQDLTQSRGYEEVVLHGDLIYYYPHRVLYYFPAREGLRITQENGYISIQNPRDLNNVNIEIIKEDGTPDYIKVILISRLTGKIRKENALRRRATSEKSVILRYSKIYTTRELERNGESKGNLLFDSNRLVFQNLINSNNKFTFTFWDQKTNILIPVLVIGVFIMLDMIIKISFLKMDLAFLILKVVV